MARVAFFSKYRQRSEAQRGREPFSARQLAISVKYSDQNGMKPSHTTHGCGVLRHFLVNC
jgi:hypothetical protein